MPPLARLPHPARWRNASRVVGTPCSAGTARNRPVRGVLACNTPRSRYRGKAVVVGEVPASDAPDVLLRELSARAEEHELAACGWRTHTRIVARLSRRDALTVQPGPRPARVPRPPLLRAVDRLCGGRTDAGQDQRELTRPPRDGVGDPLGVEGPDYLQTQPAQPVGVEVALVLTAATRPGARVEPVAPGCASHAVGVLGLFTPAQADPALPDRPRFPL